MTKKRRGRKYGELQKEAMKLFEQLQFLTLFNHFTLLVMSLKYTECTIHHFESCYTGYKLYHILTYKHTHK